MYYLLVPHALNSAATQLPAGLSKSLALLQHAFEAAKVSIRILSSATCEWQPLQRSHFQVDCSNHHPFVSSKVILRMSSWGTILFGTWEKSIRNKCLVVSPSTLFFLKATTAVHWAFGPCQAPAEPALPSEGKGGASPGMLRTRQCSLWPNSCHTFNLGIFQAKVSSSQCYADFPSVDLNWVLCLFGPPGIQRTAKLEVQPRI